MNKVICILGPTASGKTDLAIKLAQQSPCDLISVDSAMVYTGMDIGTAKPNAETLNAYPHALINICDPAIPYSAAQFRQDAITCIEQSLARNRLPVLVGGSMLYHRVLQHGIAELPEANHTIRAELQKKADVDGWEALHQDLQAIDPVAANRIHANDSQRLLRALEVYQASGKTLSHFWAEQEASQLPYSFINIGLQVDRPLLRERIADRFKLMIKQGFIEEVKQLYTRADMHADLPSMKSVGYQQAWQYLEGQITHEQMIELSINATRQLAKRQVTWLRRWPKLHWLENTDPQCFKKIATFIAQC
ncbi:MAG: tRNA (adenosine(37)-N6)-dimethylallyltransferase MiaA [Pseudomonadota bacterium]